MSKSPTPPDPIRAIKKVARARARVRRAKVKTQAARERELRLTREALKLELAAYGPVIAFFELEDGRSLADDVPDPDDMGTRIQYVPREAIDGAAAAAAITAQLAMTNEDEPLAEWEQELIEAVVDPGDEADADVVEDPAAAYDPEAGDCIAGWKIPACTTTRQHTHGTFFGWSHDGCRGPACTKAKAARDQRQADKRAGITPPSPARDREHLVVTPAPTTPPLPDLGPAVDADPDAPTAGVAVDVSTPAKLAQAQLRALIGQGFAVGFLARYMNESRAAIAALADDDEWTVDGEVAKKIGNTFDDYVGKKPHAHDKETERAIAVAKARAAAMGWPSVADVRASL